MSTEASSFKHIPVSSSNIKSVAHDGSTLEVEFTNGQRWRYADVSPAEFDALRTAPSVGRHFAQNIRGAKDGSRAPSA